MSSPGSTLDARYAQLQAELEVRSSIRCFAKAGLSLILAIIVGGAAGKISWDTPNHPWIGALPAIASLVLCAVSVIEYLKGKSLSKAERESFVHLQAIRTQLKLDDPGALLPVPPRSSP